MKNSNYTTAKAYFRSNPKFGRTTQLIEKATGKVVFEGMGVASKNDLIKSMEYQKTFIK